MATFFDFRTNVLSRLPKDITENICKITSTNLDDVLAQAKNYFNVPLENLKFEIISVDDHSLFTDPLYQIISYPTQELSFIDEETNTIKNVHGEFFIRKGKGKVYLMVTPPELGGQKVTINSVMEEIHKLHLIEDIDKSHIKKIVQNEKERWTIIGKFEHREEEDAVALIDLSKDNMTTSVLLKKSGQYGADLTAKIIHSILKDKLVIYGINDPIIDRLEKRPIYNQWIEIAKGDEASDGDDSTIVIIEEAKQDSSHSKKTREHATTKNFTVVHAGNIIARKKMFEGGTEGRTVLGDLIFADMGKDIKMEGNENVEISEDGLEAKALVDGSVYVRGSRVYVDRLWVIEGDLTLEIGNIKFPGSVVIQGNVGDDFTIDVEGDLAVHGSIGNSQIKVGGNLHVGRGINGRGHGYVEVGGSLLTRFFENAKARVNDTCFIEESIINSHIISFNKVVAIEGKGRISSSEVTAQNQILVKSVGSQLGTPSELKVVSFPDQREKLKIVREQFSKLKIEIETKKKFFGENVDLSSIEHMNKKQKTKITEIMLELKKDQLELKRLKTIINFIKQKLQKSSNDVEINIIDFVQIGTKITLNDHTSILRLDNNEVKFYLKDGSIANTTIASVNNLMLNNDSSKINIDDKF